MQGSVHSGSASRDDCGRMTLTMNISFPDRFPRYAWIAAQSAHSDFVGGSVYACLGVTCHWHFLTEWPQSFTRDCGNSGVDRAPNNRQHGKLTLEKNISSRSCRDSNARPFDHESGALTNTLSRFGLYNKTGGMMGHIHTGTHPPMQSSRLVTVFWGLRMCCGFPLTLQCNQQLIQYGTANATRTNAECTGTF